MSNRIERPVRAAAPDAAAALAAPPVSPPHADAGEHAGAIASPLRAQLFVAVLEVDDDSLLVRWVESGRCHYGEQRWRLRTAVQPGRCAISGRPIAPGESVFRPVRRPVPANGDEMICPASVPRDTARVDANAPADEPADASG
ncbi:MAG: DUF3331 domain-containing protein [Burkholderia multivorans]|nr:DUF3331 domain-containing protein [Burkholderia multivorans]MDI3300476.1 DUF3331 domain-containing protein [Burkholderia multivorans]